MSHDIGDDALMAAARKGDPAAFTELVQRHRAWVYQVITAIVRDHTIAEDLTQDVFCQVYDHLSDYCPQGTFIAWLKRIAVNRARNQLRNHHRRFNHEWAMPTEDLLSDEVSDPAVIISSALLRDEVRTALKSLTDQLRQVIVRHYFEGQSVEVIARALGCPVGTVKSRLFNGRRLLREQLHPRGEEDTQHRKE